MPKYPKFHFVIDYHHDTFEKLVNDVLGYIRLHKDEVHQRNCYVHCGDFPTDRELWEYKENVNRENFFELTTALIYVHVSDDRAALNGNKDIEWAKDRCKYIFYPEEFKKEQEKKEEEERSYRRSNINYEANLEYWRQRDEEYKRDREYLRRFDDVDYTKIW